MHFGEPLVIGHRNSSRWQADLPLGYKFSCADNGLSLQQRSSPFPLSSFSSFGQVPQVTVELRLLYKH